MGISWGFFRRAGANGMTRFRDTVRRFWRGDSGFLADLASRLTGSSDVFERSGRGPGANVNFITSHDGFTLEDLVSYGAKHNENNGEGNADGPNENFSWNCGTEGPTSDTDIAALRRRQKRNMISTLLLSQGTRCCSQATSSAGRRMATTTPIAKIIRSAGSIGISRTAKGHFMTSCGAFLNCAQVVPCFATGSSCVGRSVGDSSVKDIAWFLPNGREMSEADWSRSNRLCLGVQYAVLDGNSGEYPSAYLLLMNASDRDVTFSLPAIPSRLRWSCLLNTIFEDGTPQAPFPAATTFMIEGRSLALLAATVR